MPDDECDWGEGNHERGARLFVKMGTPRGVVDGEIAYRNVGPGQSYTRFTGISETLLVACITPIDKDHVVSRFCFTQPKAQKDGPGGGAARAIIKDVCKQFDQDKVVWDRQKYLPQPLVCDGDGPIGMFRKWYSQSYERAKVTESAERGSRGALSCAPARRLWRAPRLAAARPWPNRGRWQRMMNS